LELVKAIYETRELVDDWEHCGFGIGVVQLPSQRVNVIGLLVDPWTADDLSDPEARA
jgi:hypothetical protein